MEDRVMDASASQMSVKTSPNVRATRDPSITPPAKFEPKRDKPVGSKKLVLGEWVEVKEGDEDAG
jgi:hypothetical protein